MQQDPIGRFEWERLVLRCALPRSTKAVALTLATFASRDGSSIHPGETKLAADLGMTTRTVRRHVKRLRDEFAVIKRVRFHGSRRAYADEYRLVQPDDLAERVRITSDPELVDNSPEREPGEKNHRTCVTESPDSGDQITGHECPPTTPRPPRDHFPTPVGHSRNVEGATALAVAATKNPQPDYAAARAALERLPDLGAGLMHRAREDIGDGAGYAAIVIRAAQLKEPP